MIFHRLRPSLGLLCDPVSRQICVLVHDDGFPLGPSHIVRGESKIAAISSLREELRGVIQDREDLRIRAVTFDSRSSCSAQVQVTLLLDHRRSTSSVASIRSILDQRLFCHRELNAVDADECDTASDVSVVLVDVRSDGFHPDCEAFYDPWLGEGPAHCPGNEPAARRWGAER